MHKGKHYCRHDWRDMMELNGLIMIEDYREETQDYISTDQEILETMES